MCWIFWIKTFWQTYGVYPQPFSIESYGSTKLIFRRFEPVICASRVHGWDKCCVREVQIPIWGWTADRDDRSIFGWGWNLYEIVWKNLLIVITIQYNINQRLIILMISKQTMGYFTELEVPNNFASFAVMAADKVKWKSYLIWIVAILFTRFWVSICLFNGITLTG